MAEVTPTQRENYRQYIQDLLTERANLRNSVGDEVEAQTLFDTKQDHYQLIFIGWFKGKRVFGPVLHLDIKPDGKIWIQWNGTEIDIAEVLEKRGVPKDQIVIGFHSPELRQYTEYANL